MLTLCHPPCLCTFSSNVSELSASFFISPFLLCLLLSWMMMMAKNGALDLGNKTYWKVFVALIVKETLRSRR